MGNIPYTDSLPRDILDTFEVVNGGGRPRQERNDEKTSFVTFTVANKPEIVAHQYMMSLKDICSMISSGFRSIWHDYAGCKFYPGNNGFLQLRLIFVPNRDPIPQNEKRQDTKIKNIDEVYIPNDNNMIFEMNTRRQRRSLVLTNEGKAALRRFMVVPMKQRINWDECCDEIEFNGMNFHRYGSDKINVLAVRNINVESILGQILVDEDVQFDDYNMSMMAALAPYLKEEYKNKKWAPGTVINDDWYQFPNGVTREMIESSTDIVHSYSCHLHYKGYQNRNSGGVSYDPRIMANNFGEFDNENYYAVITVIHNRAFQSITGLTPTMETAHILNCY